jgi:hypothetical protein
MKSFKLFDVFADNRKPDSLASRMRINRFDFFLSLLSCLDPPITILDVGGTEEFWKIMGLGFEKDVKVTLLNLWEQPVSLSNTESIRGDARNMQFTDCSFDVVFSNSVIEHVGGFESQQQMAGEIRRVGKRYFVQTPNRYFFIEPHFLFPFFQFLPVKWKMWLIMHFRLGWIDKAADPESARAVVESVQLLSKKEVLALFPDCNLFEEKIFGITKSFIAYAGWD